MDVKKISRFDERCNCIIPFQARQSASDLEFKASIISLSYIDIYRYTGIPPIQPLLHLRIPFNLGKAGQNRNYSNRRCYLKTLKIN